MSKRPSASRRDFLTGKAAGQAAADAIERAVEQVGEFGSRLLPPELDVDPASAGGYVLTLSRRAMACNFELRLNAMRDDHQTPVAMEALDLVERLEAQLTVYRDTSEVVEINRRAATEPVEVESGLFGLLRYAGQLHDDTQGAFDLTSGPLSRAWGFDVRRGRMPTPEEIDQARQVVGWNKVLLDDARRQIRFTQPGVEINLNSVGKGYALDQASRQLETGGATDFLFHGGRSTLLARGNRAGEQGWMAGLRHPLRPRERIAQFRLVNEALSTSGSATQSFRYRDKSYGHLIDPRTGWPADGLHSATVIAPTATEADALSTVFYVMGIDATEQYCATRPRIRAVLVLPARQAGEVELRALNFDS